MRKKKVKELRQLMETFKKQARVELVIGYKSIWWNPLSWFFKRFRKKVTKDNSRFYKNIAKESYKQLKQEGLYA